MLVRVGPGSAETVGGSVGGSNCVDFDAMNLGY